MELAVGEEEYLAVVLEFESSEAGGEPHKLRHSCRTRKSTVDSVVGKKDICCDILFSLNESLKH